MNPEDRPTEDYLSFIKDKHERLFNTPDEVSAPLIKKATGSDFVSKERIIKGEANEVYSVTTSSGEEVILRICHNDSLGFEDEKWAIEASEKAGVPVPKVLLTENVALADKKICISIESKLPGIPLNELRQNLSEEEKKDLGRQAGEILSKINSVKMDGFGRIKKDGKWNYGSIQEVLLRKYLSKDKILAIAKEIDFDTEIIEKAFAILEEGAKKFPVIQPRLIHNDFAPKHLLIENNKIVGVLDFETAEGGDPVREFARWEFFSTNSFPTQYLIDGYADKTLFTDDFENRMHLWMVYLGILHITYYHREKNQSGLTMAKESLARDIQYFS